MKIIPTAEDIQDAKGYQPAYILTHKERSLNEVWRLRQIAGCRKLWGEVMPTGRNVRNAKTGYTDWVDWLDLPPELADIELEMTREYLARKLGWKKSARQMKMPGGWMLAEAFEQVDEYSPDYLGNPITPMSSPHKLQKWGWAVWRRARQILKPYGWSPSRKALEAALVSHAFGQVGKIAVRVAAASLPVMFGGGLGCDATRGHNSPSALQGLRESRRALINARGWHSVRKRWAHDRDVVECIGQMIKHHGMAVNKAEDLVVGTIFSKQKPDNDGYIRSPLTGGRFNERVCLYFDHGFPAKSMPSLMDQPPKWSVSRIKVYHAQNPVCTDYHTEHGPSAAVRAWKKQVASYNERIASSKKLEALLNRKDGGETVVFFQESLDSGNCEIGTRRWAEEHGYNNCAPLIEVAKDQRYEARRVVDYVISTY